MKTTTHVNLSIPPKLRELTREHKINLSELLRNAASEEIIKRMDSEQIVERMD